MNEVLLHPTYFPSIVQMAAVAQAKKVVFEIQDNYQKQTYRNRAHIAHANGRLLLNVPIRHAKGGERQKTKGVAIENNFPWQEQHWKSLQIGYRTSPFFEYYEDDLAPLFQQPTDGLLEHNQTIFVLLYDLLGMETPYENYFRISNRPPTTRSTLFGECEKRKNVSTGNLHSGPGG